MNAVPNLAELVANPAPTNDEKLILSAVDLLSATTEFRALPIDEVYARVAAGADLDIAPAN